MTDVLHVTDTHLRGGLEPRVPPRDFADAVHQLTGRTTDELAAVVIDAALATRADGVPFDLAIHTGDVTEAGEEAACHHARALLGRAGRSVLVAPGNHDRPAQLGAVFGGDAAEVTCSRDVGAWRVVLVSTTGPAGTPGGCFGPETLADLDAALLGDRPVLIGCHHPPLSTCGQPECVAADAWQFFETIDRHPNVRAVASGHLHVADELQRRDVRYLLTPSTSLQLRHHHPLAEHNQAATAAGARTIRLHDDGTFDTSMVWVQPTPLATLARTDRLAGLD